MQGTEWVILPMLFLVVAILPGLLGFYLALFPGQGFRLLAGRRQADPSTVYEYRIRLLHRAAGLFFVGWSALLVRLAILNIQLKSLGADAPTTFSPALSTLELVAGLVLILKAEAIASWCKMKRKRESSEKPEWFANSVFLLRLLGAFLTFVGLPKLVLLAE